MTNSFNCYLIPDEPEDHPGAWELFHALDVPLAEPKGSKVLVKSVPYQVKTVYVE